ncbi:MAG TPA: hypothetical protein VFE79_07115 [Paraburkholderia sp.]|nr:hypothetical protein [Paraburkholderia sp.]
MPLVLVMMIVVDLPAARWVEKKGYWWLSLVFGGWAAWRLCGFGFGFCLRRLGLLLFVVY